MRKTSLRCRSIVVMLLVVAGSVFVRPPYGLADPGRWEVGGQAGVSFANGDESFRLVEVLARYGLPWRWDWGRSVRLAPGLTAALGVLEGGGDLGLTGSLGLELVLSPADESFPFELRLGSAVTLLSREAFGDEDFSGPVQFTEHIGLYYRMTEALRIMVQGQHMSNAGLYDRNPGLNAVMLGIVYRF
jgi:hypothetical protein